MNNSKIQSLTEVLQKLNKDGITETLRKEALEWSHYFLTQSFKQISRPEGVTSIRP